MQATGRNSLPRSRRPAARTKITIAENHDQLLERLLGQRALQANQETLQASGNPAGRQENLTGRPEIQPGSNRQPAGRTALMQPPPAASGSAWPRYGWLDDEQIGAQQDTPILKAAAIAGGAILWTLGKATGLSGENRLEMEGTQDDHNESQLARCTMNPI